MSAQTFTPDMLKLVQEDTARKLMTHLNYNADFTDQVIRHLFSGEPSPMRPSTALDSNGSLTNKNEKTMKPKRQYTKSPAVIAQRAFNAANKEAVLAQIKSENIDSKKVAGTLSKRLAEMWKSSAEKAALTGEKTPQKNENTDSINDDSEENTETFMIDLGEGEIQCYFKNENELWSNGIHVANKVSEDEYELI